MAIGTGSLVVRGTGTIMPRPIHSSTVTQSTVHIHTTPTSAFRTVESIIFSRARNGAMAWVSGKVQPGFVC
jgi:hypothetical protein